MIDHQHWFSLWLGAFRKQAMTLVNVDPDLCHPMAWLSHNELNKIYDLKQMQQNSEPTLKISSYLCHWECKWEIEKIF